MGDGWWNQDYAYNQDQGQASTGPELLNPNTTYAPPGNEAPIDQYNFVPNPAAAGGYDTYGPGQVAPVDMAAFSNTSGQYPNDGEMSNAIANNIDLTPNVDQQGNASFLQQFLSDNTAGGFGSMPQNEQDIWNQTYGQQAAPYVWAQQAGLMQGAGEGFGALPQDQQNIWYGTYGQYAPQVWQQQKASNDAMQGQLNKYPFLGNYPASQGGGTVAPSTWADYNQFAYSPINNWYDPATGRHEGWGSIGAGTAGIQYGYGVPGFGQAQIPINPEYMKYLENAPGYIPGSGTYNQWVLNQPGLTGTIGGVPNMNMQYGSGGVGDPTTGLEQQSPQEWIQGGKLFNWNGMMGQGDLEGLSFIGNLFGRSDTPSGLGTPAFSAPKPYWDGLAQAIGQGKVQPTARGWQLLQSKGYTPQSIGGAAVEQAKSVGAGAGTGTGQGPMGPGTQAFNYQAAYLDYLTARMNQLDIPGMQNLNDRQKDQLAFEQAKQRWLEGYQQMTHEESQRQFNMLQGVREGQLTGMYGGNKTLAAQAQEQDTSLRYLNLLAQMRGPGDIFQYMKVLQGTPGGIKDIVNAAAGAYRMPGTGGGATVGGYSNPSDLSTLMSQMNNPNFGAEAQNLNLPLPNQINALALQRMSPSQQQMLLGAYESAGYNPQDVMAIFKNSLPQYAGQGTAGRVGLFGR